MKLNISINEAYNEINQEESILQWQNLFGKGFGKSNNKGSIIKLLENEWKGEKLDLPINIQGRAYIICNYYSKGSFFKKNTNELFSADEIGEDEKLRFAVKVNNISHPYEIKWQVVNTGPNLSKDEKRGDFFDGKNEKDIKIYNSNINWEVLKYKGIHWVQCFIIKEGKLVGKSEKFYVIVK